MSSGEPQLAKKRAKDKKQWLAKKKVVAQEDAFALEDKAIQSLCPDLLLKKKHLPSSLQGKPAKPANKGPHPSSIAPHTVTPVIESPSQPAADLPTDKDMFEPGYGFESGEELPPISIAATSESEGLVNDRMDVDSNWESEPPIDPLAAQAKEAVAVDDSSDEGDEESEAVEVEDEAALFKEFLAQQKKTKVGTLTANKDVPLKASAIAANKRLSKVKTVVNKFEVHQDIMELQLNLPTGISIIPKIARKRPSQLYDKEDSLTKHPKSDSIGGLAANWEKAYHRSKVSANVPSNTKEDIQEQSESELLGEFAQDEDAEVLKIARKVKNQSGAQSQIRASGKGAKIPKKSMTVKLELVSINEIDGKECGKVKVRKSVWKFEDLPLSSSSDIKLFKQNIVIPILDWSAMLEGQFSSNNHSDLKPTVTLLWDNVFGHVSNELGKAAMVAVTRNWKQPGLKGCKTAEQQAEWVKNASKNKWFVYEKPENMAVDRHGAYLGPLLIQTMSYHIQRTASMPTTFGPPAGALALAAAAAWKKGVNSLHGKQSKNSPESFGKDPWATVVKQHFKNMSALSTDKWNEIYLHCWEFSLGGKGDDGEELGEEDDNESDDVNMSG
ncbi:hypothetical protein EDD18DRAFT_1350528 [Armillaria luteobubalina]|uniref:Uncharacterized protein n=1 Tax=Armillaria luteobubalina TaxID=153913 RepID=A0AA39UZ69_9AGAR|nr:hypothetical protein EDD18DRAFT_1350528 [Armillaria luteobubalina]